MFGVLVVKKGDRIGYLWGFSGRLAGSSVHLRFVPPIFNILEENSFYRKGEQHLAVLTKRVDELVDSRQYIKAKNDLNEARSKFVEELKAIKSLHKERKITRSKLRSTASEAERDELSAQSMRDHFEQKELKEKWNGHIAKLESRYRSLQTEIECVKQERKAYSGKLQDEIFRAFSFLNSNGESKDLKDIFSLIDSPIPSGAGECAAPKLLHYAYKHQLHPLALAEFWWGSPPQTIIRKHGHYYPSCKSKCKPILEHMLKGLSVEPNALEEDDRDHILEVIYEDDDLIAVNKPEGLLSVPGNTTRPSVLSIISSQVPNLEGPVIVHRLDMSTSGIMLLAKNIAAYHALQDQFAAKTVKKKYIAILDGVLKKETGTIDLPLRVDLDNRPQQMVCYDHGKKAITEFKFIERKGKRCKVEFFPITGRTHQLRVHASHPNGLNMPIVGDDLYGTQDKRLMLHAKEITFSRPSTGESMTLKTKDPF